MKIDIPLYLKGENVSSDKNNPTEAEIIDMALRAKDDLPYDSDHDQYELTLLIENEKYMWSPNMTALRILAAAFGRENHENWLSKKIKLWHIQGQAFGKDCAIIRVKA